jgi:hypothetical protein
MCSLPGGQARSARGRSCDTEVRGWGRWAREDLERIRAAMLEEGLSDVPIAGPRRIATFLANTAWAAPAGPARRPDVFRFSPLETLEGGATGVCLGFTASAPARVSLDYGLDAPELDSVLDVGSVPADEPQRVCLRNLEAGQRYLARLRARIGDREMRGGYHWIFTAQE